MIAWTLIEKNKKRTASINVFEVATTREIGLFLHFPKLISYKQKFSKLIKLIYKISLKPHMMLKNCITDLPNNFSLQAVVVVMKINLTEKTPKIPVNQSHKS